MGASTEYLAGFIDGEGCIGIYNKGGAYHQGIVVVEGVDKSPLEHLYERYGGSLRGPVVKQEGYRPIWRWEVRARAALRRLVSDLEPHLLIKHKQIHVLVDFLRETEKTLPPHTSTCENTLRERKLMLERRLKLVAKMSKLNRRGKR